VGLKLHGTAWKSDTIARLRCDSSW